MLEKRGQVTIFVIIAVVLVGLIVFFLAIRGIISFSSVPAEFKPVYNSYQQCVVEQTRAAIQIAGVQGGRIDTGVYVPGSNYAPFSSQLNFLGIPIPYWSYVTGNNLIRQNVPSKSGMQQEIADYIKTGLKDCDLSLYTQQGFYVTPSDPAVKVVVNPTNVVVDVSAPLVVSREGKSARQQTFHADVTSKLGTYFAIAQDIYSKENSEAFLENYTVDFLRLYAPVDGVEVSCSPKIWKTPEVVQGLKDALEANIGALHFQTSSSDKSYFAIRHQQKEPVRVLYSQTWPGKIEITPADQALMVAEPIGNQQGLGVLGFCYVPYHFVYDISFPVLFQIGDENEIFQFPVAVVIKGNQPREANLSGISVDEPSPDVCAFKQGRVSVSTYDNFLNPIAANISYTCFDTSCPLGQTNVNNGSSSLTAAVPICVNGYITAEAGGYATKKQLFSSNSDTSADIILDKQYHLDVKLLVDGRPFTNGTALIHFAGSDGVATALLPDTSSVDLKEGLYNVSVYVYGASNIVIPASTKTQCQDVAQSGIAGLFGATREKCFDVQLPEVKIDSALTAGGTDNDYFLDTDLQKGTVTINVKSVPNPTTLEQLQYNYEIFNALHAEVSFS